KTMKTNPLMIYSRLLEAKTIFNKKLLDSLVSVNIKKNLFNRFLSETKGIININEEIIELDKLEGEFISSLQIIYSLVLRMRGLFILQCLVSKKPYSNKLFRKELETVVGKRDAKKVYEIYYEVKTGKRSFQKLKISVAESLLNYLKKRVTKGG
ncbi:hypothetical protein KAI32_02945, partial [Candidatus Pacearchaeota archaeon]|nr:hypothetical protein [Candidatus Pacearchaeota archaeon]